MSKLLITGGAGFIGSNFIRYWLNKYPEDHIVNFDKLTYAGHLENLKGVDKNPHYTFFKGDIVNKYDVDSVIKDVDLVVHFAAESHVDRSIEDPMVFARTNVSGTCVLLDACLRHGRKRFHHISTDEVFGELKPNDPPFNENTHLNPKSPYAASKAASDLMVKSYYTAYGLPVTITNCSNNFGPYQDPEKMIPNFITKILNKQKIPLAGEGKNIRSWISVDDHNRAVDLIIKNGKIGESYCVGGVEKTNLEVATNIVNIFGEDSSLIGFVGDRAVNDFRYAIDNSKILKLGWKPEDSFENWLKKTVFWYANNRWWWEPLIKSRKKGLVKQMVVDFVNSINYNR